MEPTSQKSRLRAALIVVVPAVIILATLPFLAPDVMRMVRPSAETAAPSPAATGGGTSPTAAAGATSVAALPAATGTSSTQEGPAPTAEAPAGASPVPGATASPTAAKAAAGAGASRTPIVVTPAPPPRDVFEAATRAVQSTAEAAQHGTPTATPPNMITATYTPKPVVITRTPTPGSQVTAEYRALVAKAVAASTGTPTPFPAWVTIATDTPTPTPKPTSTPAPPPTKQPTSTPVPILVPITPQPTPAPSATPPAELPGLLTGKILFISDRQGSPRYYALDPADGRLYSLTRDWAYRVAQAREGRSPDGQYTAQVQNVTVVTATDEDTGIWSETQTTAQLFVRDNQFNIARRLIPTDRSSYDPAWSPAGDRIAFVSAQPGNDEIYTINPDGSDMQRLTSNSWEWDKHPTWSPDGKQIAFWSNREGSRRQLWVMNADGSDQRKLLDSPSNDWDPIWVK